MTAYAPAISAPRRQSSSGPRWMLLLVGLIIILMSLWPLYGKVVSLVQGNHAEQRHNGERYPPSAIRACLAALIVQGLVPYQYEDALNDRVVVVCRLDYNRFGVQINRVITTSDGRILYTEITTFYSTLNRVKNILFRDGYQPVVPLPEQP